MNTLNATSRPARLDHPEPPCHKLVVLVIQWFNIVTSVRRVHNIYDASPAFTSDMPATCFCFGPLSRVRS